MRLVNQVVDKLQLDDLLSTYKGGGTSRYHPRMLLKVLFYAYFCNIYSCRRIAQALEENIHFMWLSGNSTPDFRTINDFRSKRLKNQINHLFAEVVRLLHDLKYVSLDVQYIDGTKLEAASNRYSFVWKGSVEKNKAKLEDKINGVLSQIKQAIREDKAHATTPEESSRVDATQLRQKLEELNQRLPTLGKKAQKQVKKLQEEHLPRLEKYEQQLQVLGERNSYSKTDEDASFMRMKEDHMKNGQLKPAYNTQISTENQFITHYSLHQRPGDVATLISHLEEFEKQHHKQSEKVVADAGYGSEQNYEWLEEHKVEAFVKYNYFHKEQKRNFKNNFFHTQNLYYNQEQDYFVCPMGQHMEKVGEYKRKSELGYEYSVSRYRARCCQGCPLRGMCHKGKGEREIEVNHKLRAYRAKARERLLSEEGVQLRKRRAIEPEAVFGQLKSNNRFNRFKLRSLAKVRLEFGLAAIGHNLRKMVTTEQRQKKAAAMALEKAAKAIKEASSSLVESGKLVLRAIKAKWCTLRHLSYSLQIIA